MSGFYRIPHEVKEDVTLYRLEVEKFGRGEVSPNKFKPFRVSRGIYGQREKDTFMVRIRVPAGGLTPTQMDRIADLSEQYGNGVPHVTDRQDVQLHWVRLDGTAPAMKSLTEVGLATRGGGGNTVRNVTACPYAGVCPKEVFDVTPYAVAVTEHLIGHEKAYSLPRKYKVAFSGCAVDGAFATVNDLGFIAKTREVDGRIEKGFRVYVAGGMGAKSRVADLLEDFVPEGEVASIAEAVMVLFDKHGNRKDKHKARLRFVMDKYGYDKFVALYREELAAVKAEGPRKLDLREFPRVQRDNLITGQPPAHDPAYQRWLASNTLPQKPDGYFIVKVRLEVGDIKAPDLRALAQVVRDFGEGSARATQRQNILIRWVSREELYPLYQALSKTGLARPEADGVSDVICCPGATTCNLGICHAKGMADFMTEALESIAGDGATLDELKDITVKISGCPNACGQHPIGHIGLHGAARRNDGRLAPYYQFLVGGRVEEGKTALADTYGFVPAKSVPALVKDFLSLYLSERNQGEGFYDYLDRRGRTDARALAQQYAAIPTYEDKPEYYLDWGKTDEFSLAGLGPGECGAGVFDMIETDIEDARRLIKKAEGEIEAGNADPSEDLYKAVALAAKSLLVTQGLDPNSDLETFKGFEDKFVATGLVSDRFKGVQKKAAGFLAGLLEGKDAQLQGAQYARELADTMAALYDSMDDSLKFFGKTAPEKPGQKKDEPIACAPSTGVDPEEIKASAGTGGTAGSDVFMDLRGVACPMNYVRAKLRMEEMEEGQTIMLYLDEGAPIQNVPVSLGNDGQQILKLEKQTDEYYEVLVKKLV